MATKKVSKSVGNARLTKLALFLLTLPETSFDYGTWVDNASGEALTSACADPNVCGTTACALGWAPSIPSLRKAGLGLEFCAGGTSGDVVFKRGKKRYYGTIAGEKAFGITNHEAMFLFLPGQVMNGVKSPATGAKAREVAHHILAFVAGRTNFKR